LGKYLVVGFTGKSTNSEQQNVENQSQAENIADGVVLSFHIFDVDDLRSYVARGTASDKKIFFCL
jgi:hypothetical protein